MTPVQKAYVFMGGLVLLALGALIHGKLTLTDARARTQQIKANLDKVESVGQLVYEHLEMVKAESNRIEAGRRKNLNMNTILELTRRHNLKAPASSKETLIPRPTFNEKKIDLKLKEEYLDGVVQFMIEAETLGSVKVSRIDIVRSSSDNERWNCTLSIVQRIKKDLP